MSDANKYVNSYIEITAGTLHQYLNDILQLKTQLKLANDIVSEKDATINSLQADIEKKNSLNQDMEMHKNNAASWENQFNAMKSKVSHMDTMTNQIIEMKQIINQKNEAVGSLEKELQQTINQKNKIIEDLMAEISDLKSGITKKKKVSVSKKDQLSLNFSDVENEQSKIIDDF
jgi:chromosome segregation ATPase